jgi:tellurite resistance protein TerC
MITWILFISMISCFLALDLGVFNREAHIISYKEATKWTIVWTTLGLLFSIVIYFIYKNQWISNISFASSPTNAAIQYITGYLIELSLSVDNIFVIAVIFRSFKIPQKYQHRVLFWGILGALVFRGIMIAFGVILIQKFSWMTIAFGIFLVYTAIKMAIEKEKEDSEDFDPKKSFVSRQLRKIMPITWHMDGEKFFIYKKGLKIATPLLLALIVIEFTDILFALDSIPAILSITKDPFLVFTSNIFAIMGLRSMYFFIANMLDSFHYLKYSLVIILAYVGTKLILEFFHIHLPISFSLGLIFVSLAGGILASRWLKSYIYY